MAKSGEGKGKVNDKHYTFSNRVRLTGNYFRASTQNCLIEEKVTLSLFLQRETAVSFLLQLLFLQNDHKKK